MNRNAIPHPREHADLLAQSIAHLDRNHVDVLEAVCWWIKGFNGAHPVGASSAPNINALGELQQILSQILDRREASNAR